MERVIDLKKTLYELTREYPEIVGIMQQLGFKDIAVPGMISTAGRFMTIPKGAAMKGISMEKIKEAFRSNGFEIRSDNE